MNSSQLLSIDDLLAKAEELIREVVTPDSLKDLPAPAWDIPGYVQRARQSLALALAALKERAQPVKPPTETHMVCLPDTVWAAGDYPGPGQI